MKSHPLHLDACRPVHPSRRLVSERRAPCAEKTGARSRRPFRFCFFCIRASCRCHLRLLWASIVNPENRIVGIGYNGFPRGCDDDELPWAREADSPLDTKYPVRVHYPSMTHRFAASTPAL